MVETYSVKTEVFEGPLELLLNLIEKRKLFINDISLAAVTDDYISFISKQTSFPVSQAADFILIASTLLLIKSKSLLPALELSSEEQESIEDLERRLALYKRFRELTKHIKEHFGVNILFSRQGNYALEPLFSPDDSMTVAGLEDGMRAVLHNLPQKKEELPKTAVKKVVSLDEMIDALADRINTSMSMSFREFSGTGKKEKVHIIVSFLAMLELVKQGVIAVKQNDLFSDITMEAGKEGSEE